MPAKRKTKKELVETEITNTIVEPVVLQLPITSSRLDDLMGIQEMTNVLEYNPNIVDPQPYTPQNTFVSFNEYMNDDKEKKENNKSTNNDCDEKDNNSENNEQISAHSSICYWCCHAIDHMEYGMPIRYDVFHKSFTMYGTFCSLECVAAYNFSTHMGSDRVWEIHSWIQMLAHRYGYTNVIRPAPSRYLLKLFNGPMSIEEFRNAHKGFARTYINNIPPFIHVTSQMEILNTSFLDKNIEHGDDKGKNKKKISALMQFSKSCDK